MIKIIHEMNRIFNSNVVFGFSNLIFCDENALSMDEYKIIHKSCNKRQKEFIFGRAMAKSKLEELGYNNCQILQGNNREPIWPDGLIGSISHTDEYCFVAVTKKKHYDSIGIDIELAVPLPSQLEDFVCTDKEISWIYSSENDSGHLWSKLIFCAKESAYKCIFPLYYKFIDFQDVIIDFQIPDNRFRVEMVYAHRDMFLSDLLQRICGYFLIADNTIYTVSIIKSAQ